MFANSPANLPYLRLMKIWRNFKPYNLAKPSLNRRRCFGRCYGCKQEWKATGTLSVHMVRPMIDGVIDTRFICDGCLKDIDDGNEIQHYKKGCDT